MTRTPRTPRRLGTALASAALLAGCTATGATTSTPPRAAGGVSAPAPGEAWLLYQGLADRGTQIRLIRPDGTGDHAVVPDTPGTDQTNPDWSPDGGRFVFALTDGRRDDLWVARADGSAARLLVDCAGPCTYLDDPAWSPDGSSVAFARTSHRGRVNSLEILDLATGDSLVVQGSPTEFFAGPRWSPDGRYLVCEAVTRAGRRLDAEVTAVTLTLVDARAGVRLSDLTDPRLFAATADWSPTRTRIVYSALPEPGAEAPDLFSISPFGGEVVRLTTLADAGGYAAEPTYTPDGRTIVFSGQRDPESLPGQLLRVGADGGDVATLVDRDGRHPRWRPGTPSPE